MLLGTVRVAPVTLIVIVLPTGWLLLPGDDSMITVAWPTLNVLRYVNRST
jgi:hypothetical protein